MRNKNTGNFEHDTNQYPNNDLEAAMYQDQVEHKNNIPKRELLENLASLMEKLSSLEMRLDKIIQKNESNSNNELNSNTGKIFQAIQRLGDNLRGNESNSNTGNLFQAIQRLGNNLIGKLNEIQANLNSFPEQVTRQLQIHIGNINDRLEKIENFITWFQEREAARANDRQTGVSIFSPEDNCKSPDEIKAYLEEIQGNLESQCLVFIRQDLNLDRGDKEEFEYIKDALQAVVAHYLFQGNHTKDELPFWLCSTLKKLSVKASYLEEVKNKLSNKEVKFIGDIFDIKEMANNTIKMLQNATQYGELTWINKFNIFDDKPHQESINEKNLSTQEEAIQYIFTTFPGYRTLDPDRQWSVYLETITSTYKFKQ